MTKTEAMYSQGLLDSGDSQSRSSSGASKVIVAVLGGSCLTLLCVVAMANSHQSSNVADSMNLLGLAKTASPQMIASKLPGEGPWKNLALAGLQNANRCDRDVSMNAKAVKSVLASMNSVDRAMVAKAEEAVAFKAQDLKAGQTAPLGYWDPLSFATGLSEGRLLFYREVEIKHGRVCMLASLGFLVGENFHPLFGGDIDVPSYIAFQQTPLQQFWPAVALAIGLVEFNHIGDFEPNFWQKSYSFLFSMKTDRVPGDLGFDPLGLKPKDEKGFLELQNKELNNGRLAMLAAAGMIAQELATGQKILG